MALFLVNVFAQQYVDLGLESGTLWKDQNEKGFYTYTEAERNFGNCMPTAPQLNELVNSCAWEWTDNGYKITGPNGKSIFLPAEGYYSCGADPKLKRVGTSGQYWSKTMTDYIMANNPDDWDFPYCLTINSESKSVHYNNPECCKFTIRLVFEDEKAALKAKMQNQLADGNERVKSEVAEQRKQEEEQKRLENQKKLEEEAKREAEEEDKRLETQCISLKDIDGNKYKLVKIGTQCWMAENLRTTHYADGTEIALSTNVTSGSIAYRYCPNGDKSKVIEYGYLYNWPAIMHREFSSNDVPSKVQGICPDGWHMPSLAEWNVLLDYVGSKDEYQCGDNPKKRVINTAKALASKTGWKESSRPCSPGNMPENNNSTNFNMKPAGWFIKNNNYNTFDYVNFGEVALLGTATAKGDEFVSNNACIVSMSNSNPKGDATHNLFLTDYMSSLTAATVRCVRGAVKIDTAEIAMRLKAFAERQARKARTVEDLQSGFSFLSGMFNTASMVYYNSLASSYPTTYNAGTNTGTSDYSSESDNSSSSSNSEYSVYEPIGTATGIKITESGSCSSISAPVEKDKITGNPFIVVNGKHHQLVRSKQLTDNGVDVTHYSYCCHVTSGSRMLYVLYVNF